MRDDDMFPGLTTRRLTDRISWRFYKHWGQGYLAGEGIESVNGDHSGGLDIIHGRRMTNAPCVVQARVYEGPTGWISAVYSYPNGIGMMDNYFWEIYTPDQGIMEEVERFDTEEDMEQRVIELLGQ